MSLPWPPCGFAARAQTLLVHENHTKVKSQKRHKRQGKNVNLTSTIETASSTLEIPTFAEIQERRPQSVQMMT
jgi:hypothetical protein